MKRINLSSFYLLLVFWLYLFSSSSPAYSVPVQRLDDAQLAELIQTRMVEAKAPALAVSIVVDGKVKRFNYGSPDLQQPGENTVNTAYEIGSMSKAFTGLAIQILNEQGKLSLKDDIHQYLPHLNLLYQGKPAKLDIEDFLYHTSGLPFSTLAFLEIPSSKTVEQQLQNLNLKFKPKSHYFYASANYDVLGAVIEKVTGQSYHDVIATLITQPFGMSATVAVSGEETIANKATGYKIRFGYPVPIEAPIASNHVPSAYIHSTLADMEKWLDRLLDPTKLDPTLRRAIERSWQGNPHVPVNNNNSILYASGWLIEQRQGSYINHGGQNPNYSSCIALRPDQQIGIVALANISSNIILELCSDIDSYLHNQPYSDEVRDLFLFMDFIFSVLTAITMIIVVLVGLFIVLRIRNYRQQNNKLSLNWLDWGIVLLVPLIIAGIIYVSPGLGLGINWHFIALWLPSTLLIFITAIIFLVTLLTLNYRIKKKISHNKKGSK